MTRDTCANSGRDINVVRDTAVVLEYTCSTGDMKDSTIYVIIY